MNTPEPTSYDPQTSQSQSLSTLQNIGVETSELLDLCLDFVAVLDEGARLLFVSRGVESVLGQDPQVWIGRQIVDQVHPDDLLRTLDRLERVLDGEQLGPNEIRIAHYDGHWIPIELLSRRIIGHDGKSKLVLSVRDVSDRHELHERLKWQSSHDPMTGLLSWTGLKQRFDECSAEWKDDRVIVIRLDIDRFQRVNEYFGHEFADEVLCGFADRLLATVPDYALVSRLGGDDFVVVQPYDPQVVTNVTDLAKTLGAALSIDGVMLENKISAGVVIVTKRDGVLLGFAEAESALYSAKKTSDGVAVFDSEMRAAGFRRRSLEATLRRELAVTQFETNDSSIDDRLTLHYQPVVDAVSKEVVGFEGLARWVRSDGSSVSPSEFIPIAEATGLIIPLGRHLLKVGVENVRRWMEGAAAMNVEVPTVSMNVSAAELQGRDFVEFLVALLNENNVPPSQIIIEVTESHVMENIELATATLRRLREAGCSVAIDDFGTGYSSFGYLRDLPADIIKIDRSFVTPLGTDARSSHIVRAIVDLSKRLGFTVVAEGIETTTQADMLIALGVDRLQGFAFGRAVAAVDAFAFFAPPPRKQWVPKDL
jgi:diguanylate cyclase (GGDEF)-like protein/PAS domain S-box-containing protein